MIKIEKTFKKYGDSMTLLDRKGDIALFHRSSKVRGIDQWEVVFIKTHNSTEIHGKRYEARESMPSSSQWGSQGWTFTKKDNAVTRFNSLCVERGLIKSTPIRVRKVSR